MPFHFHLLKTPNAFEHIQRFTLRSIAVGGGPSGPSIEGPFCRTVHLCCTLREKSKKREKNKEKRKKNRNKRERNE